MTSLNKFPSSTGFGSFSAGMGFDFLNLFSYYQVSDELVKNPWNIFAENEGRGEEKNALDL